MNDNTINKFGARIYKHDDGTIQIKQTLKSGSRLPDNYVIDEHKERFVENDPYQIGMAVLDALHGKL